ncbi:MAG TPA: copper transporter [Syntrophomonadaceae bacterium]|nr:copper transporter [Syntrophomonadaceae bacterium]
MVDLKYHIVSIIGIFLALGIGILIGSTLVSDDLMVGQQRKMIDALEEKFTSLREREADLIAENERKDQIIKNYENFSQAMLPVVVENRLQGQRIAMVVTGGMDVPAGMLNTLAKSGANLTSQTIVLSSINMQDAALRNKIIEFYQLKPDASSDVLRQRVAQSVAMLICNQGDPSTTQFLQQNKLVKFSGDYNQPVDHIVIMGGAESLGATFMDSFDAPLIDVLLQEEKVLSGVEVSYASVSFMEAYQKFNITTIDNIDLSPGQISLVLSMGGEPGNYGIKDTASKFMPSLPVEYLRGR